MPLAIALPELVGEQLPSGHAPLAADFEARLSDARRIRDALKPP
jgi:hypothetical protein